jgi:hypothetical protein
MRSRLSMAGGPTMDSLAQLLVPVVMRLLVAASLAWHSRRSRRLLDC